jgi:hypothetical protein
MQAIKLKFISLNNFIYLFFMKHLSFLKLMFFINLLTVCASSYAQTARVVDNKGTIRGLELGIGNVAEIYNAAVTQTINGVFSDISFATAGIVDAPDFTASTITYSITINKAGRYEVTYRVSTASTNNERNGGEFYLDVSGTESPGTRAYTYSRNNVVNKNTVTVTKIIVAAVGTVIKVKGHVYSSSSATLSLTMVANGSSLIVKRIK